MTPRLRQAISDSGMFLNVVALVPVVCSCNNDHVDFIIWPSRQDGEFSE